MNRVIDTKDSSKYVYLTFNTETNQWIPTSLPIINPIIIPGSFNPIHEGYVSLAQAAIRVTANHTNITTNTTMLKIIWNNAVHPKYRKKEDGPSSNIVWEISMTNADKPPITPEDFYQRLHHFYSANP